MTYLQAIVLGIIQGLTEFLPVSSSGHLIFVPVFFGWADQGISFDAVVHLGTLLAVVLFFRKKIWAILSAFWERGPASKMNRRLAWLLMLSIIPAGLVGLFGEEYITSIFRSPASVAYALILWGIVLYAADRYHIAAKKRGEHLSDLNHISARQMIAISLAQALALIPGTSRSGITMTTGLFAKLDRTAAAEFSFLMSIPVITIAGGLKLLDLLQHGFGDTSVGVLAAGFIASALSGFAAIWGLMSVIKRWSFLPFAVYRVVIGIAILIFLV